MVANTVIFLLLTGVILLFGIPFPLAILVGLSCSFAGKRIGCKCKDGDHE